MKRILVIGVIAAIFVIAGCMKKQETCPPLSVQEIQEMLQKVKSMPLEPLQPGEVAVLETNYGDMVIEFFPEKAPQHVAAFKRLVEAGYYDCTKFHRLIPGFMVQGGDLWTRDADAANDGGGPGPGYQLVAEFNDIPHERGVLSMARGGNPNSAGSQFFICFSREKCQHLDGQYTVFGKVVSGLDVLDKIENVDLVMSPVYNDVVLPEKPVVILDAEMVVQS